MKHQFLCFLLANSLSRELAHRCPVDRTTFTDLVRQAEHLYVADLMVSAHHPSARQGPTVNTVGVGCGRTRQGGSGVQGGKKGKNHGKGDGQKKSGGPRNDKGQLVIKAGKVVACWHCQQNHCVGNCPTIPQDVKEAKARRGGCSVNEISDSVEEPDSDKDNTAEEVAAQEAMAFPSDSGSLVGQDQPGGTKRKTLLLKFPISTLWMPECCIPTRPLSPST